MPVSNQVWVNVADIPPYEDVGWEVICRPLRDMSRAYVENPKFISLQYSIELSAEGTGTIEFDLDSSLFKETLSSGQSPEILLTIGNIWEFYFNGSLRHQWIAETINRKEATESGTRTVQIIGPGTAVILRWALVLPKGSPNVKALPKGLNADQRTAWNKANDQLYVFKNTPIMSDYITLIQDAQKRGTIPWLETMFSRTKDAAGKVWQDTKPPLKSTYVRKTTTITGWAQGSTSSDSMINNQIDAILRQIPGPKPGFGVVGHGDNTESYQLALNRASAVRSRLQYYKRQGSFSVTSKGSSVPKQSNSTPDGQNVNRRVDVTYTALVPPKFIPQFRPQKGVNLYDLLQFITGNEDEPATLFLDWMMRPPKKGSTKFRLDVRQTMGTHREYTVRFFESDSVVNKEKKQDGKDIRNYVGITDNAGGTSFYIVRPSTLAYGQREQFILKEEVRYPPGRQRAAKQAALQHSEQHLSWTLQVADKPGRTAFIDYNVGDWIGIENQIPSSPVLKFDQFYDDFLPSTLDTKKWINSGDPTGIVVIKSTGGLQLRGPVAGKFARVTTRDIYNFVDSYAYIQIDSMIFGGDGLAEFKIVRFDNVYFSWRVSGNVIRAMYHHPENEGGGIHTEFQKKWSATEFKYVRMRHRSSTAEVLWESSRDGKTWVVRAKLKVGGYEYWLFNLQLQAGDFTDPVSGGIFGVRRVNTQSSATGGLMNIDRTPGYGSETHRVMAISGEVDSDGKHTLTLTLASIQDLGAQRTARILAKFDNARWQNSLPNGVLEINNSTYGYIGATQQIIPGQHQLSVGGQAAVSGQAATVTNAPTQEETYYGTGTRLRYDADIEKWVPVPNVWMQDEEPGQAAPGDFWTKPGSTGGGD